MSRIAARFAALRAEGRAALVPYLTAGDPEPGATVPLLRALRAAGADLLELGVPFSDPMADGPVIQAAGQRALAAGITLGRTLALARRFREKDAATPLVLMGYYNPIYIYGVERFLADARASGLDGVIVVDLPPEEDSELCLPARDAGLAFIRLTAPTTDEARLPAVLANAGGFVYHIAITGITGAEGAAGAATRAAVARLKRHTDLPVAVGFGIKTPAQAAEVARAADAAVVGSALVGAIARGLDEAGVATPACRENALALVRALAAGVRRARKEEAS